MNKNSIYFLEEDNSLRKMNISSAIVKLGSMNKGSKFFERLGRRAVTAPGKVITSGLKYATKTPFRRGLATAAALYALIRYKQKKKGLRLGGKLPKSMRIAYGIGFDGNLKKINLY